MNEIEKREKGKRGIGKNQECLSLSVLLFEDEWVDLDWRMRFELDFRVQVEISDPMRMESARFEFWV